MDIKDHRQELLDTSRENSHEMAACADELFDLARAFAMTGNREVADRLADTARRINACSKAMQRAVSGEIAGALRDAETATGNILAAALAMATRDERVQL